MLVVSKHGWDLCAGILIQLVEEWALGSAFLLRMLGHFDIGVLGL